MNEIFVSTTFHGADPTDLAEVLALMADLPIGGIEFGSTHRYAPDLVRLARSAPFRRRVLHNFFPPTAESLVLNLASADDDVLQRSREHCLHCLDAAAEIGAELYTVHPGFLADAIPSRQENQHSYDFTFAQPTSNRRDAVERMVESLSILMERAKRRSVPLAIETEGSLSKPDVLLMQKPEEYSNLFQRLPDIGINLNIAHSVLASRFFGFDLRAFITQISPYLRAVELSHNDGSGDQHKPLVPQSAHLEILDWLPRHVPIILEFREATVADLNDSLAIVRSYLSSREIDRQ